MKRSFINLMVPYYGDTLPARQEELDYCIVRNTENPHVARVFLFMEGTPDTSRFASPKVTEVSIGRRMTYEDGFRSANAELRGQLCIIANTDIYFDESLRYLSGLNMERRCFCLSRYDVQADGSAALVEHSGMDAWIFVAPITGVRSDFPLGVQNCDLRIAYELHRGGYAVSNPNRLITAWHLHTSGKRTASARVPGPCMLVPITDRLKGLQGSNKGQG